MWEYRWTEVPAGSGPDAELTRLGADGWEAVGMDISGEHLGKTWVRVLLKRPVARPAVVDVTDRALGHAGVGGRADLTEPAVVDVTDRALGHAGVGGRADLTEPAVGTF